MLAKGWAPKEPGPRLTSHYPRIARWTLVTRLLVPSAALKTSSVVNSVHRRFKRFPMVMTSTGGAGPFTGAALWLMSFLLSARRSFFGEAVFLPRGAGSSGRVAGPDLEGGQVAVLRPHVASSCHVTASAYSPSATSGSPKCSVFVLNVIKRTF
jgi:hypothetical protein